jgi:arginase family enzyme
MDAFASAFAPGVSAPAADGFAPHEVGYCLRLAGRNATVRVFDVVEMNPSFDIDHRTAKLAATMIMEILAGMADRLRVR